MAYDIIIKSGMVFDGAGQEPASAADVGVRGDEIAFIGDLNGVDAPTVINAYGKYVAPGFIDITNHSDTRLSLFTYPHLESMLMQGVTTIIGGNCGSSLAPLAGHEAIKSISKWADLSAININWATFDEYLAALSALPLGINFGSFAGYGTLRRGVAGDTLRPLQTEEKEGVKQMLRDAIAQGAFGMSTGLSYSHERISPTEELIDICSVLRDNKGIFKVHLRSEGIELLAAVNEVVRIGREADIPVHISHLKAIGKKAWRLMKPSLELIRNARSSGVDITVDISPYHSTGSLLYLLLPPWARHGGFTQLFKRIDDPEERRKITLELKNYTLHYDKIRVLSAPITAIVGKTLAQVAERAGIPPEEALLQTLRANEGRVTVLGRTIAPINVRRALEEEYTVVASDGEGLSETARASGLLTHPRSFGAFPHFWHRYVSDRELILAHKAIAKMTGGPARRLGIHKRGILKKGAYADIVVFDPKLFRDRATIKDPFQYPQGIEAVLVNGALAVEGGKITGERGGKILRKEA